MWRKITRISVKVSAIIFFCLIVLLVSFYFLLKNPAVQTWFGIKATQWLSREMKTTITVSKVNVHFFSSATLEGVKVLDKHGDTLFTGNLHAWFSNFNYRKSTLNLDRIRLTSATVKVIRYKGDSLFNFSFLTDYFQSEDNDTTPSGWQIQTGEVETENVYLLYQDQNAAPSPQGVVDFSNTSLRRLNGRFSGLSFNGDTINVNVHKLSFTERSGFRLLHLSCKASISGRRLLCEDLHLRTPASKIKGRILFNAGGWDDYTDFVNRVRMDATLTEGTFVNGADIASFTSALRGLAETVSLSGEVKGTVSDLNLRKFSLGYREHTRFKGNVTITGLPDFSTSYLHVDAKELNTHAADLQHLPLYPFTLAHKLELPAELYKLGMINYKGKFDGFTNDFTTYGKFRTGLGNISTKLSVRLGKDESHTTYHGTLACDKFNAGYLLGIKDLHDLSFSCELKGSGLTPSHIHADVEGVISGITYNGYHYSNIKLKGQMDEKIFTGLVVSKDPNADFDFNGTVNFSKKVPEMDFISTINNLELHTLNFTDKSDSGSFSSQILIKIQGDNIDNLTGQVHFDNTQYKTKTRVFKLSTFNVQADQSTDDKRIRVTSAYLNAFVRGNFNITNLAAATEQLLYNYYPTYFKKPATNKRYTDALVFQVSVKKFKTISELFLPQLMVSPATIVEGNFNAAEHKLNLQLSSPLVEYNGMKIMDLVLILNESNRSVLAEASGKKIQLSDSVALENFNVALNSVDRESGYAIDWDNLRLPSQKGEIRGRVNFENDMVSISNEKMVITANDSTWTQLAPSTIVISKNGRTEIQPFTIKHSNEEIGVKGIYSETPGDSLLVETRNVKLEEFNPLLRMLKLNLQGTMNGRITLAHEKQGVVFIGDLTLSELILNENTIGQLVIKSKYNAGERHIYVQGYTSLGLKDENGLQAKNISFDGTYYLDRKTESIDLNFETSPANLRLLNPFLEGIIQIRSGFVNGKGKIHGTPSDIKIDGKFRLFNSEIKVDYTNVVYNITGDIEVMPDQIRFSDLLMREKGSRSVPQGTINGNIFHNKFSKMKLDYDITYRNMLVINTTETENKTFHGRVYGSGNIGLYGFLNDLHMVVRDTTTRNTRFYLPLDGPAEVDESDFIHFVIKDTAHKRIEKDLTGFDLDLWVYATPEAHVQIILDKRTGDVLNAQGSGLLKFKINTLGKFEMFGQYVIDNGDYIFTLENVIHKKFDIVSGSSIAWSGNPLNAEIDVVTSYKQRVSVAPLLNEPQAADKSRTPVDCQLVITGKLFSPNIRFKIDFPNLDANTKASINNVLSDEAELNRQVAAFLVFRSFITPQIYNANGGGVNAGNAAASTGGEIISNRVSEFLNTYVGNLTGIQDLQLGLNYKPGSTGSGDAVDIALSKQFLNNKISVDGNIGVSNSQSRNNNGLIGDVNIDYKLSDDGRFRLKGFNRSNDITQSAISGGQYTQGVGFFYREEFETLQQFMRRFRKRPVKQ
jgi:hypothetical protein